MFCSFLNVEVLDIMICGWFPISSEGKLGILAMKFYGYYVQILVFGSRSYLEYDFVEFSQCHVSRVCDEFVLKS